jgi:hypothetical protein
MVSGVISFDTKMESMYIMACPVPVQLREMRRLASLVSALTIVRTLFHDTPTPPPEKSPWE